MRNLSLLPVITFRYLAPESECHLGASVSSDGCLYFSQREVFRQEFVHLPVSGVVSKHAQRIATSNSISGKPYLHELVANPDHARQISRQATLHSTHNRRLDNLPVCILGLVLHQSHANADRVGHS
jgi:hypothetical protein